ncbi:polycomb group protein EMF2B-like isoform X2 [Punica granatum]|uniref:Polycomb group protein EMF2B-like isoform X2 n=1 Tax=Punica granatum TaxID=22663 RepID=A0A6P8DH35_PUNGR|nr:polycomb group protein EMF2B-like isoform X2 [Punica granatum]
MCRQSSCVPSSVEEAISAEESLLVYCKPVELYNILQRRAKDNPSFLQRCLRYRIQAKKRKRSRAGVVIFNYRDYNNVQRKIEVTEEFSCPFCLIRCASFKATEEYQAVNVSVKIDMLETEGLVNGKDPRVQTFYYFSKPRRRLSKYPFQSKKHVHVQFLELDASALARDGMRTGLQDKDSVMQNGVHVAEDLSPDCSGGTESLEHIASSFNVQAIPIAIPQSIIDPECVKSSSGSDPTAMQMSKVRKPATERSDSKSRGLLLRRQFYHSHRVQPMAVDQVLSDRDSEDEVDDGIADFEDRRMLDDFVDVTKDEKHLMHLWNSFVRKQRVLADGHVPWACEAFSKLHGQELVHSHALFWCWRLFMIKLWNHGLLDGCTMNSCNVILEGYRGSGSYVK